MKQPRPEEDEEDLVGLPVLLVAAAEIVSPSRLLLLFSLV